MCICKTLDERTLAEKVADEVLRILERHLELRANRLVDRHEMADLAGISVPTLDRLVKEGLVPSSLVGKRRLFEPSSVIETLVASSVEVINQSK